jgi:hypothetical protein
MRKVIGLFMLCILVGCGVDHTPLIEGPPIPRNPEFVGESFIDKRHAFSFRYYPAYKEIHRDLRGAIISKDPTRNLQIVVLVWPLDLDTYMWYRDAFNDPRTLKRRLRRELKVFDKILSYRILEKEGADAFLFTTLRPSGLYNQRIEIFPKENPLQISLLFQHKEEDLKEVLDMIGTIRILKQEG